ncbi:hypothetical protein [Streptomyces sp. NPDC002845]
MRAGVEISAARAREHPADGPGRPLTVIEYADVGVSPRTAYGQWTARHKEPRASALRGAPRRRGRRREPADFVRSVTLHGGPGDARRVEIRSTP